jgi:hypothetical protein
MKGKERLTSNVGYCKCYVHSLSCSDCFNRMTAYRHVRPHKSVPFLDNITQTSTCSSTKHTHTHTNTSTQTHTRARARTHASFKPVSCQQQAASIRLTKTLTLSVLRSIVLATSKLVQVSTDSRNIQNNLISHYFSIPRA